MKSLLQFFLLLATSFAYLTFAESAFEDEDHHADHQHHVHEHGVANMNLVGDKNLLTIEVTIPMLNLTGFEHKPQNNHEQKLLDEKLASIKKINNWLIINEHAECKLKRHSVDLNSKAEHPDIDLHIEFYCDKPDRLQMIQSTIFAQLESLEKIDAQWIIANKQSAKTLTTKDNTIHF